MELKLYEEELKTMLLKMINSQFPGLDFNECAFDAGYSHVRSATFSHEEPAKVVGVKEAA